METAWMTHPNLPGQPIEVPKSAVTIHSHSGWTLMDEPPKVTLPEEIALAELESAETPEPVTDSDDNGSTPEKSEATEGKRVRRASTHKGDEK